MEDKIQIVSWLLTRRCNLKCEYCGIVKNYKDKPKGYPDMSHYHKNEMTTEYVIDILKKLKEHNSDCFNILYGGEPLLRSDLSEIVNFCNDEKINYTIITNNTEEVQPMLEKLFKETDFVTGLTSSIDPIVLWGEGDEEVEKTDRYIKSVQGYNRLLGLKDKVKDLVAEMTIGNEDIPYIFDTIKILSSKGINTDITFVDIAKNESYDFSAITDRSCLVKPTFELADELITCVRFGKRVHMADTLIPRIFNGLPSNYNCKLENGLHNLTIDSDGSVRLCLRIRGSITPRKKIHEYFNSEDPEGLFHELRSYQTIDKHYECEGCNWTCIEMSKLLRENENLVNDLVHKEIREESKGDGIQRL